MKQMDYNENIGFLTSTKVLSSKNITGRSGYHRQLTAM